MLDPNYSVTVIKNDCGIQTHNFSKKSDQKITGSIPEYRGYQRYDRKNINCMYEARRTCLACTFTPQENRQRLSCSTCVFKCVTGKLNFYVFEADGSDACEKHRRWSNMSKGFGMVKS